jgi:tRNA threonylcarbamoyladenosine biosynthesis protein TsaB
MLVLGVDTSTGYLTVSIIKGDKVLADYNKVGKLSHSALLVPTIQKALKKAKKKLKDVGLFAIGVGPGSFTGLRVGVTTMRALAIALNKPIVGVPTMDAIAYNVLGTFPKVAPFTTSLSNMKSKGVPGGNVPTICPVIDAKKNQVYACIYSLNGDKLIRKSNYLLEPVEHLIRRLSGNILFLGDGIHIYKKELSAKKALKAVFIDDKRWFPRASIIAKMGLESFKKGRRDDPYDLEPMYLYARDCNVRRG